MASDALKDQSKSHRAKSGAFVRSRKSSGPAKNAPKPTVTPGVVKRKYEPVRRRAAERSIDLLYSPRVGVDEYVHRVAGATPMQLIEIERRGVGGTLIKDMAKRLDIPSRRFYVILGLPKATAEKKAAAGETVGGSSGHAAIGMVKLLGIAQDIVSNSKSPDAESFDAAQWLGRWIERPQPALAGRRPSEMLDTPTGVDVVARLLGSLESGAYQ